MSDCPTCRKPAQARAKNSSSPFCSERCRQVDLGKWLNEAYSLPADDAGVGADDGEGRELS